MKNKKINKLLRYFLIGLIVAILTCSFILPTSLTSASINYVDFLASQVDVPEDTIIVDQNRFTTNSYSVSVVGNQNPSYADLRYTYSSNDLTFLMLDSTSNNSFSAMYFILGESLQINTYTCTIRYYYNGSNPLYFRLFGNTNLDINLNNAETINTTNSYIEKRFTFTTTFNYSTLWLYFYNSNASDYLRFYSIQILRKDVNLEDFEQGYNQGFLDGSTSVEDSLELGIFNKALADITVYYNDINPVTYLQVKPDEYFNAIGFTSFVNTSASFFRMDIKLYFYKPWLFSQYPLFLNSDNSIGQDAIFTTDKGQRYNATTATENNYQQQFIPVQEELNNSFIVSMEFSFYQQTGYYRYLTSYSGATLDAYNNGFNAGKDTGYNQGFESGEKSGLERGEVVGYNKGYQQGITDAGDYSFFGLISAVIEVPINAITSLFNFEVFGYNLTSFVLFLFTLAVILVVLKMIL